MPDELRFTSKDGFLRSLKLPNFRRPARPTLQLSKDALETPLADNWLREVRQLLTRSGAWEGHPIDSAEQFLSIPAPGVTVERPVPSVIGIDEPVFTSSGFGAKGVKRGAVMYDRGVCEQLLADAQCEVHMCLTHETKDVTGREPYGEDIGAISAAACYDSFCGGNTCHAQNCSSLKCSTQTCYEQFCSSHLCGTHKQKVVLLTILQEHWDHPFVRELAQYFRLDVSPDLVEAIKSYVGRNMYDQSVK
jgi:hypothetical protein